MSNLPISSKYRSTPAVPVDEAERDSLTTRLNDAFAAGDVDSDSYRALLDQLYAARTLGELAPVVERLPARSTYDVPAVVSEAHTPAPGQLSPGGMNPRTVRMVCGIATGAAVLIVVLVMLGLLF